MQLMSVQAVEKFVIVLGLLKILVLFYFFVLLFVVISFLVFVYKTSHLILIIFLNYKNNYYYRNYHNKLHYLFLIIFRFYKIIQFILFILGRQTRTDGLKIDED